MGSAHAENGDGGEALLHFTLAEEVARSIDSAYERTRALLGVADVHASADRPDVAFEVYGQALDLAERTGSRPAAARALAGLARTARSLRRDEPAREYGRRALEVHRSLGSEAEAESLRRLLLGGNEKDRRLAVGANTGPPARVCGSAAADRNRQDLRARHIHCAIENTSRLNHFLAGRVGGPRTPT